MEPELKKLDGVVEEEVQLMKQDAANRCQENNAAGAREGRCWYKGNKVGLCEYQRLDPATQKDKPNKYFCEFGYAVIVEENK